MKEKITEKALRFKSWLFGLGIGGSFTLMLWFVIKAILCAFFGVCIL